LATGRSSIIALDLELAQTGDVLLNPYFSIVVSTLSEAAVTYGFTFRLLPAEPKGATVVPSSAVSGAIAVDPTEDNRWIPLLVREGIHVVTIGRYPGTDATSWVDNDHPSGLRGAMNHLRDEGYERVVLMTAAQRSSLMLDLEDTFRTEMQTRDLTGRIMVADDLSETTAHDLAKKILSSRSRPDAVVAAIDRIALGVLRAADELGISVPDQLGVVGLGDTVLAQRVRPGLTSIRSTPKELAERSMDLLWEAWLDPSLPNTEVLLPAELVIRESTSRSTRRPAERIGPAPVGTEEVLSPPVGDPPEDSL
jgi:DNA-binding LacI/PurR family transcriptional regulator